jgi:hypothetical protein
VVDKITFIIDQDLLCGSRRWNIPGHDAVVMKPDDLGRAAQGSPGLAVPDGKQYVAMCSKENAEPRVGTIPVIDISGQLQDLMRLRAQTVELRLRCGRFKVLPVLASLHRERRYHLQPLLQRDPRRDPVCTLSERGHHLEPSFRKTSQQLVEEFLHPLPDPLFLGSDKIAMSRHGNDQRQGMLARVHERFAACCRHDGPDRRCAAIILLPASR